jgi:hypothetical protein
VIVVLEYLQYCPGIVPFVIDLHILWYKLVEFPTETIEKPTKLMNWISKSASGSVKKATPSILLALLGIGAIYLIVSDGFIRKTGTSSKATVDVPQAGVKKESQSSPAADNGRSSVTSAAVGLDSNETNHRATTENNTGAAAPTPAPVLTPAPTPAVEGKEFAMDSEFLQKQQPDGGRISLEKPPKEAERKNLERKRAEAERERARLEEMYQKHLISIEAYKKGEEKYKSEIEKYRSAVNGNRAPKSQVPAV